MEFPLVHGPSGHRRATKAGHFVLAISGLPPDRPIGRQPHLPMATLCHLRPATGLASTTRTARTVAAVARTAQGGGDQPSPSGRDLAASAPSRRDLAFALAPLLLSQSSLLACDPALAWTIRTDPANALSLPTWARLAWLLPGGAAVPLAEPSAAQHASRHVAVHLHARCA